MNFEHRLDEYIAGEMQQKHIPGLSLAVVKDGSTVIEKSYGLANVELGVPATRDSAYEIASITKSFTAAAIMLLVMDGALRLDDPLTRFRAGLPDAWAGVTVRRLLTHTSGVTQWSIDWKRPDLTATEICDAVFGQPLRFMPGSQWEYVDTNYNLLGMVIHQLAGRAYDVFLQERIFTPHGMTATRHNAMREIIPNRASGYEWGDDRLLNAARIRWNHLNIAADVPANGANGSLLSTVADLLKWDAALFSERVLKQPVLDQMWTPVTLTTGARAPCGFGWDVEDHHGHRLVSHGGGLPGFSSNIARFVDDQLTVIILTNQDSDPWDMCKAVAGLYDPAL